MIQAEEETVPEEPEVLEAVEEQQEPEEVSENEIITDQSLTEEQGTEETDSVLEGLPSETVPYEETEPADPETTAEEILIPEVTEEPQAELSADQEDTTWQRSFYYKLENGHLVLIRYNNQYSCYKGTDTDVTVPAQAVIDGVSYTTELGLRAFYQSQTIESLSFEDGVLLTDSCEEMFADCYKLKSLDISNLDFSIVKSMYEMFKDCRALTDLNFGDPDTSNVTTMAYMFYNCYALKELDLSKLKTGKTTNMDNMFYGCSVLESLNIDGFDTGNVTDMSFMFYGCRKLPVLDVSMLDTGSVTTMKNMFADCDAITELDVSKLNTEKATDMSSMFSGCDKLTSLKINGINTSNVTNMSSMFTLCSALTSLDISMLNTSKVTSMGDMFSGCSSLASLDISMLDTSKVVHMHEMFNDCSSLKSLSINGINTSNVTSMSNMFYNCSALTALDLSRLDTGKVKDMSNMFYGCDSLITLNINGINTSGVTNMTGRFYNCSALPSLDLSSWNTGNVANMSNMFYNCSALTSLEVSGWNTGSVTNMSGLFYECNALSSLDVSKWNTGNVTNMSKLFYNCSALSAIDVNGWNTGNTTNLNSLFYGCSALTSIDISSLDISKAPSLSFMFYGCSSLTDLKINGLNTSNVTNMSYMFADCSSLIALDISMLDTAKVTSMSGMFSGCSSLTNLNIKGINTSNVTSMSYMFADCSAFTSLDVSMLDTTKVTSMSSMFNGCSAITSLDLSMLNTSSVTDIQSMFYNCVQLTKLNLYGLDLSKVNNSRTAFGYLATETDNGANLYLPTVFPKITSTLFNNAKIQNIYYSGTEEQWKALRGNTYISALENTEIHFNYVPGSEEDPEEQQVEWEYSELTNTMIIRGDGNMMSYTDEDVPWKDVRDNLLSVVIGNDFESIGSCVLQDSEYLLRVYIPAAVTEIKANAFNNTPELQDVYFAGTQEQWEAIVIGDGNTSLSTAAVHYQCPYDFATVWEYDPETSTLKISGNGPMMDLQDTSAPWYIFKDQITTVVIKEGITEIGAYTFKDIINLNRMYIPVSLSRFNEYALANDQLLLDIYYAGTEEQWGNIVTKTGNDILFSDVLTVHYNSPYIETESENTIVQIKRNGEWYDALKVKQSYYLGKDEEAVLHIVPASKYDNVGYITLNRGEETLHTCLPKDGVITFVPGKELLKGDMLKIVLCTSDGEPIEELDLMLEVAENSFIVAYYYNSYSGDQTVYKAIEYHLSSEIHKPDDPVREGYKFKGWYTNQKCTGYSWFSDENSANRSKLDSDLNLYAKWSQFDPDIDAWSFANDEAVFVGTGEPGLYEISTGDLNKLYDIVEMSGNMSVWERIRKELRDTWGGSCYGMSVAAVLAFANKLDVSAFQHGIKNVHDATMLINTHAFADVSNIESMINFYYLRQFADKHEELMNKSLTLSNSDRIRKIVETMSSSEGPFDLELRLAYIKNDGTYNIPEYAYHSVVAYAFDKENDNSYSFKVYDCSFKDTVYQVKLIKNGSEFSAQYGVWEDDWKKIRPGLSAEEIANGHKVTQYGFIDLLFAMSVDDLLAHPILTQPSVLTTVQSVESENQAYYKLNTAYPSFTITDGKHTAVVRNCVKESGDLELTILGNISYINRKAVYAFELPALEDGEHYTVTPADYYDYSTTLTYHNSIREIYSGMETKSKGVFTFYTDGTVNTEFEEPAQQTVTVMNSEMNTPWYKVVIEGISTGITAKPTVDKVIVTSDNETEMNVSAGFPFSDLKLENIPVGEDEISITSGENDHCIVEKNGEVIRTDTFGYTVIFDSRLGSYVPSIYNITKNSHLEKPDDPVRDGYIFEGWYKDEDYLEKWDFDTDTIQKDTVLYAGWSVDPNNCTSVIFHLPAKKIQKIIVSNSYVLTKEEYPVTEENEQFVWYSDPELTKEWIANTSIDKDTVLYTNGWNESVAPVLVVRPEKITINIEDQFKLNIESNFTDTYTWSSGDESIATVDETGKVTAVSDGIVLITVTAGNGLTAVSEVTVTKDSSGQSDEPDPDPEEGLYIKDVDSSYSYTGTAIKPVPEVYDSGKLLTAGKDYTVTYKNNTNAYTYEGEDRSSFMPAKGDKIPYILITGKGNYSGKTYVPFSIEKIDINDTDKIYIEQSITLKANGKVQRPVPVITFNGKTVSSKEYTLTYLEGEASDSEEIVLDKKTGPKLEGTYTIRIEGKDKNFTGTKDVTLTISDTTEKEKAVALSKAITIVAPPAAELIYDGEEKTGIEINPKPAYEGIITEDDYTVTYTKNVNAGTATVTATG
ncbi:MAG: BspA family leucine-rich repeat surface protein, partial [Lachnospiraceae bacterium]|nr:BspA family leucine-rich repeat surface protein [Lachnospiraceae bacterium]